MSDVPPPKDPEKAVAKAVAALADLKRVAESRAKRNQHIDIVDALFNSAQAGNSEDFKILVHLANNASLKVLELSQTNFESARQIARRFRSWPSLLYQSKRINEMMISLVTELELGAESPHPVDVKTAFARVTTQNPIAFFLLAFTQDLVEKGRVLSLKTGLESSLKFMKGWATGELQVFTEPLVLQLSNLEKELARLETNFLRIIQSLQAAVGMSPTDRYEIPEVFFTKAQQLPPLTETSIRSWTDFGWGFLKHLTNARPEVYPALRILGKRHEDKYLALRAGQKREKETAVEIASEIKRLKKLGIGKKSGEDNIRADIAEAIRGAYDTVLKNLKETASVGE